MITWIYKNFACLKAQMEQQSNQSVVLYCKLPYTLFQSYVTLNCQVKLLSTRR
jgi:hypothetical protein